MAGALVLSSAAACTNAGGNGNGPTINHVQVSGEKPAGQPVAIEAQVTDDDGVESVAVFYQAPHAGAWNSALLSLSPTLASTYLGEIPGAAVVAPSVSYYLEAKDRKGVTTRLPANAPSIWFTITVGGGGGDQTGPTISHVRIADGRPMGSTVTASAKVTDATGVGSVTCRYRAQGATDWIPLTMTTQGNDTYQANFPITAIVPEAVEYYLEAIDTAPAQNRSTLPTNAPDQIFTFTISHGDETPPVITHTKIADGQPEGRPAAVIARIEDATGVARAEVFYRTGGTTTWTTLVMTQSGTSGQWSAIIPASAATSAGVDYYIEAEDSAPLANVARAPDTAPDVPYHFTTAPESCVVPPLATESFEAGIFPGWWRTYGSGTGCEWTVDDSEGYDGTHSAYHAGYGTACNDLLVLPCLDLTGLESEGLVIDFWQEQSSTYGTDIHTLEWAQNSADPGSSTYTVVGSALPAETSSYTWGYRKVTIPAGHAALGKTKVYFAFRYSGNYTSAWYLDSIRVRQPGPAIEFSHITASPNPVTAGAANVALSVTLRNSGDGPSLALTGTLTTTDAGITINTGTATFPGVAAGGETTSAAPFTVSVAGGHAGGNAPLKLQATDGTHTYNIDVQLFIGQRATAHVVMYTAAATWESDTELYLGVGGDPTTPEWLGAQIPYVAADPDTSGTFTYDVDLTAQVAHLPPTLQHPWFLKVVHNYTGTLEIHEFTISYGATTFTALGLPWVAPDDSLSGPGVGYLMVPEPPRFVTDVVATTPTTLAPGSSGVQMTLTVRNLGSATQGALTGTLSLKAPTTTADVTGLAPTTALSFASGPVGNNGTATSASSWTFNVTTAHNDGSPLNFNLHLVDATTSLTWDVPVKVDVPWPGITVLDWAGATATLDSDGVPDPGESAYSLVLVVQNTGSLVTAGPVTATFVMDGSSTAPASIAADTMHFGNTALAALQKINSTDSVALTLLSGAQAHQKVVLRGTLTDGTNNWVRMITIPIYAHIGSADPQDSTYALGTHDLRFAQVNCDNTTLDVRLINWDVESAENAGMSVIVAHPTSGAALRLATYYGALSAYTLNGTGGWDAATVPASLKVTPASGSTIYLNFRVALSDVSAYVSGKQTRLGAQEESSSSTYDYLPDAWGTSKAPADLVLVSWP
ncbi:MAG: choice-of-anchor J domain-containing protein [Deltaproteobacteria bacterium]|nr:choice-of-anchor J domain-containing protein [Deltaproteobacteria bacterium]